MANVPTKPGFYWAKWKIATEGTDNCHKCGYANSEWEVVHVVHNGGQPGNPEEYMAEVCGVSKWQPLDNFFWGEEVKHG